MSQREAENRRSEPVGIQDSGVDNGRPGNLGESRRTAARWNHAAEGDASPSTGRRGLCCGLDEEQIARAEQATKPDPGRVTARRLNRAEYNNTVRDLLGVDFRPADDFPQDDSGYGFDNIGDVLSLSPVLMEKYLKSAETIVHTALFGPEKLKPTVIRHQPPYREFKLSPKALTEYDETGLSMPQRAASRCSASRRTASI